MQKAYIPLPQRSRKQWCLYLNTWFRGNPRSWEETLQRGEPKPVSLSAHQVSQAHTIFPGSRPCDPGSSSELLGSFLFSLPARLIPSSLLTPPRASQNWGRCDSTKHLHRSQRWNGVLEHQSWSHGGWWEAFRNKYYILKKILLNLCSKFQE